MSYYRCTQSTENLRIMWLSSQCMKISYCCFPHSPSSITSIIWNSFLKDCVQLCDCLETEILVVHKLPDMVETINQNYLVDIIYLIFQRGGPFIQSPYFWEGKRDLNLMPKYLPLWFFVVIHFMLYLMTRWEAKLLLYSVK